RDDDQARDDAREERVTRPEPVVGEVPGDRPGKDEQTEAANDPRSAHVPPKRVGAARTDSVTSHLLPSILRAPARATSDIAARLNQMPDQPFRATSAHGARRRRIGP